MRARILFAFLLFGSAAFAATATVPALRYSTYLSGSHFSTIAASTTDAEGFEYVTGVTRQTRQVWVISCHRHFAARYSKKKTLSGPFALELVQ